MCYFERIDYACGDWKWGNMKEQCAREYRTGETCGAKLSYDAIMSRSDSCCKICQDILVKKRRIAKEEENLTIWKREPHKFRASIEKSESERALLVRRMNDLELRRPAFGCAREARGSTYSSPLPWLPLPPRLPSLPRSPSPPRPRPRHRQPPAVDCKVYEEIPKTADTKLQPEGRQKQVILAESVLDQTSNEPALEESALFSMSQDDDLRLSVASPSKAETTGEPKDESENVAKVPPGFSVAGLSARTTARDPAEPPMSAMPSEASGTRGENEPSSRDAPFSLTGTIGPQVFKLFSILERWSKYTQGGIYEHAPAASGRSHGDRHCTSNSGPSTKKRKVAPSLPPLDEDSAEDGHGEGSGQRPFSKNLPTDSSGVQALPEFACPFYKHNPARYGGAHGCSSYSSKNIETVCRHHLQKHLDHGHFLRPKYNRVRELVRSVTVKGSGGKRDEERWIVMYMTLFDIQHSSDVPSPYYAPCVMGENWDLSTADIAYRASRDARLAAELRNFHLRAEELDRREDRLREEQDRLRIEEDQLREQRHGLRAEIGARLHLLPGSACHSLDLIVQEPNGMQGTEADQLPTLVTTPGTRPQLAAASNQHHTTSPAYGNTSVGEFDLVPNTSMLPYSLEGLGGVSHSAASNTDGVWTFDPVIADDATDLPIFNGPFGIGPDPLMALAEQFALSDFRPPGAQPSPPPDDSGYESICANRHDTIDELDSCNICNSLQWIDSQPEARMQN